MDAVARQDRLADRPAPAALLPLRPADGQVHLGDRERHAGPRHRHGREPGDVHGRDAPAGPTDASPGSALTAMATPRTGRSGESDTRAGPSARATSDRIGLNAESCGTSPYSPSGPRRSPWRVDAVFFFELGGLPLLHGLDLLPDPLLRDQVPPRVAGRPGERGDARTHVSRSIWIGVPLLDLDGDLRPRRRWSSSRSTGPRRTPPRSTSWASSGCGSSGTPGASARSTSCTSRSASRCG